MLESGSALSPEDKWTYPEYARWEGGHSFRRRGERIAR